MEPTFFAESVDITLAMHDIGATLNAMWLANVPAGSTIISHSHSVSDRSTHNSKTVTLSVVFIPPMSVDPDHDDEGSI
jgi:hypothetical protein